MGDDQTLMITRPSDLALFGSGFVTVGLGYSIHIRPGERHAPVFFGYQDPPILARSRKAPHAELPRLAMLLGGTFDYTLRLSDRTHHDSHHQFYRIGRTTHSLTGTSDIRTYLLCPWLVGTWRSSWTNRWSKEKVEASVWFMTLHFFGFAF